MKRHGASRILRGGNFLFGSNGWREFAQQHLSNQNANANPPQRSPQSNGSKVAVAVGDICKRKRIGQRQCWRVDKAVNKTQRGVSLVIRVARQVPHQHRANGVADGEQLFRGKLSISQLSRDKWPKDGARRARRQAISSLVQRELSKPHQEWVQNRKPSAPNRVLQKHHDAKAGLHKRYRCGGCIHAMEYSYFHATLTKCKNAARPVK